MRLKTPPPTAPVGSLARVSVPAAQMGASLLLGLSVALASLTPACADESSEELVVVTETELGCATLSPEGIWESVPSPPDERCEWTRYDGRTTYQFSHPLNRIPRVALAYISFSPDGTQSSPASGDSFLIEELTDEYVIIVNSTRQAFYLRLVLE